LFPKRGRAPAALKKAPFFLSHREAVMEALFPKEASTLDGKLRSCQENVRSDQPRPNGRAQQWDKQCVDWLVHSMGWDQHLHGAITSASFTLQVNKLLNCRAQDRFGLPGACKRKRNTRHHTAQVPKHQARAQQWISISPNTKVVPTTPREFKYTPLFTCISALWNIFVRGK